MSYLDKINSKLHHLPCGFGVSVAVPHQAVTPRQILDQYVMNDIQVQARVPSDNITVEAVDEDGRVLMDDKDLAEVADHLVTFEDDFEALEAVRDNNAFRRPRKKKKEVEEPETIPIDFSDPQVS